MLDINALYADQREGVKFLLADGSHKYLNFVMRGGKTPTSIVAANECLAEQVLILCKSTAKINWAREWERWSSLPFKITVLNGTAALIPADCNVVVVNYDLLIHKPLFKRLVSRNWCLLICDEAQFLKNPAAKRTKRVFGHRLDGQRCLLAFAERAWFLSGTPIMGSPVDLWPVLHAAFPDRIANDNGATMDYDHFSRRYCWVEDTTWGPRIRGGRNLAELRERLRPVMLTKMNMAGLPARRYADVAVEAASLRVLENNDEYRDLCELVEAGDDFLDTGIPLSTARRLIAEAKVKPLFDLLKEERDGGLRKIVIFGYHTSALADLQALFAEAEIDTVLLTGKTSPKKKQDAIDRFQQDPDCFALIGQLVAAGDSITLDASDEIIFLERDWTPAINDQAMARCDSRQKNRSVMVRSCVLAHSADETVQKALSSKIRVTNQVIKED